MQQAYFKCAYECFDRRRRQEEISNCVENCSVPVVKAQQHVENEMAKFQVRLLSLSLSVLFLFCLFPLPFSPSVRHLCFDFLIHLTQYEIASFCGRNILDLVLVWIIST